MARVLVVADDLTGANATAAGFARRGMRSVTLRSAGQEHIIPEVMPRFDVVVASTDCRHLPPEEAAARVRAAVRAGWPVDLVSNRIDTTLRGNIGATTQAAIDAVAEASDTKRPVAFVAPAHPLSGRITIEGTQLMGGRRLEDTEVARDARSPMRTSDIAEILHQQSDLTTGHVPLSVVTGPVEQIEEHIAQLLADGVQAVIVDALTLEHLDRVAVGAVAAARAASPRVTWVSVDPGPAAVALAAARGVSGGDEPRPLLVLSGSATELTRAQLRHLATERGATLLRAPTLDDTAVPDADACAALLADTLDKAGPQDIVVLATVLDSSDLRQVGSEEADAISIQLARAARRVLEEHTVDGIYTTGGDVTTAVLGELGASGLDVSGEVIPLAVAGSIVGGPWDGLEMVTKGGLQGGSDAAVQCLDQLRVGADARRRQVTTATSRTRG